MARDEDKRWKCTDCGAVVLETELLMATSPFYDGDVLHGCPKCFATDGTTTLEEVCDEPGCTEQATCGFPVADEAFGGYRRTCGKHWREHEDKTPNVEFSGTPAALSPEGRARLTGYAGDEN